MVTETTGASPPVKFSQAEFDALITKAGEAGAHRYASLAQAETKENEDQDEDEATDTKSVTLASDGAVGGLVNTLDTIGGIGIPFGSVLVGAIPGVVIGEVIDGLVPLRTPTGQVNWLNPVAKVGVGWVGVQFGSRLIGRSGTLFFAGTLAMQAMASILPLDKITAQLVGLFRKTAGSPTAEAANAWLGQTFNPNTQQGGYWS